MRRGQVCGVLLTSPHGTSTAQPPCLWVLIFQAFHWTQHASPTCCPIPVAALTRTCDPTAAVSRRVRCALRRYIVYPPALLYPVPCCPQSTSKAGVVTYEARPADAVAATKRQLAEEAEARRQAEEYVADVRAAMKKGGHRPWSEWEAGPHARRIGAIRVGEVLGRDLGWDLGGY